MSHVRLRLCVLLLSLLACFPAFAAEKVAFGDLEYTIPDGWRARVQGDVMTVTTDIASLKSARVQILKDEPLGQSLQAFFDAKVERFREGRTVLNRTEQFEQSQEGVEAIAVVTIYSDREFEMVMAFGFGDRGIGLRAQMTEAEQIDAIQAPLIAILESITLSGEAVRSSADPTAGGRADSTIAGAGTVVVTSPTVDLESGVPTTGTVPSGGPQLAARRLAHQYAADPAKRLETLTLGIRASGFNIRRADRSLAAAAIPTQKAGVYFLDTDVVAYAAMSAGFTQFNLRELTTALEAGLRKTGAGSMSQFNLTAEFTGAISGAMASDDPGQQFYGHFVNELFRAVAGTPFVEGTNWGAVPCDPAILLLVLHPYAATYQAKSRVLFDALPAVFSPTGEDGLLYALNGTPRQPQNPPAPLMPGWAEDTTAFVLNTAFDKGFEKVLMTGLEAAGALNSTGKLAVNTLMQLLKLAERLESFKGIQPFINSILSIVKFITTYAGLTTKFEVLDPGQPLPRTKSDREWNEQRSVRATVEIDSSRVQNIMKQIRPFVAVIGLDLDQPPSGPVGGARVNWVMLDKDSPVGYRAKSGWSIRGGTTNDAGVVEIDVIGKPQKRDLRQMNPFPYIRKVPIGFTIGVKGPNMAQDLVDAGITATPFIMPMIPGKLGGGVVLDGSIGKGVESQLPVLGVVFETLYRVDWAYQGFKLDVKDWQFEVVLLDLNILVSGKGKAQNGMDATIRRQFSTAPSSSSDMPGAKFISSGKAADASTALSGVPGGAVANEYVPADRYLYVSETINDSFRGKKSVFIGDCVDGEYKEVDEWEEWTAPVAGAGSEQTYTTYATMWLHDKGSVWKAWLRMDEYPFLDTQIRTSRSTTVSRKPWAQDDMQSVLRDLEFELKNGDVRSYPAEGDDPPFGIATFTGSITPDRTVNPFGVPCKAKIDWTITVVIAEPVVQARVAGLLALGRTLTREALHGLWNAHQGVVARRGTTEEEDRSMAAGSCAPTNARILRGTPPR